MNYWILPEDIIELLPDEAQAVEHWRRQLLDVMGSWGYELAIPPLVEFLDSLLAGSDDDLNAQTYKISDTNSGRLMGVRADITPQIARIDAHRLCGFDVRRFAYCGEVLRARNENIRPRRNPTIIGAELYGVSALSADIEIMALLLELAAELNLHKVVLDLSHAGIFAALVADFALDSTAQRQLHAILAGKKRPDFSLWQKQHNLSDDFIDVIDFLVDAHLFNNPAEQFLTRFGGRSQALDNAMYALEKCQQQMKNFQLDAQISVDLATVGSYGYHNGMMFALYVDGYCDVVARGGRYDGVGKAYGKARAAIGFSADLLTLVQLATRDAENTKHKTSSSCVQLPQNSAAFASIRTARKNGAVIYFEHEGEK